LGGVLKLAKQDGATAIPNDLHVGGPSSDNQGDSVVWGANEQVRDRATISLDGANAECFLDLDGHQETAEKVVMTGKARIKLGGGKLSLKQLQRDGKSIAPGEYQAPLEWLEGSGLVVINPKVDITGTCEPNIAIGVGNVANLIGDTKFFWGSGHYTMPVLTNGHTLILDSGDGKAFCYAGPITGAGNIEFFMGPTYTNFKDAPMRLAGDEPNTASGKYLVRKGRVQLEKPEGVDAIAGDVTIGGQGFNDCLYWKRSHQIKDTVSVTLIDSAESGAGYLNLNGCREKIGDLTLTSNNRVKTDGDDASGGELTVRTLTVGGVKKPAGTYTSAQEPWIEGQGKVIVQP
jgi:hypothetical protein